MDSDGWEWAAWPSKRTHGTEGTRKENEIWIRTRASISDSVRKAIDLLEVKGYNEIVFKAMGSAVQKALNIVELVKKSIVGLHESTYMDHSTPVSSITITLSKKGLDDSNTDSDDEGLSKRTHARVGTREENEIWIPARASVSDYVRKAITLLEVKGYNEIVLKAMGSAVQKALLIAESVKKSIVGLHESTYMDHSTPVSSITITLSKKGLDDSNTDSDDEGLSKRTHARVGTREENEIWISARAPISDYVRNAICLLEVKGHNEIVLKAMGSAVQNALNIAELVKRSIAGLHGSTDMDYTGLVSNVTITLSKRALNASSRGYQCSESGHSMGSSWDNWSGHSGIGSWIETSYEGLDSGYLACDGGSGEEEKKQGSIFCLKKNVSMKEIEEVEDCVILESNPFEPVDLSKKLSQNDQHTSNDEQDLFVTAERGQVACRDYPHSRHLCVKFPFDKTPHVSYCEQCYCYVCDLKAPCNSWTQTAQGHCHATDQEFMWKIMRATKAEFAKTTATSTSSFQQPSHLSFSNHQSIIAETSATVASPFQQRSLRPQQPSHLPFSNHNSRHPTVKWAQRSDKVFITIELPDAKDVRLKLEPEGKLFFSATSGVDNIPYEVDIDLYDKVNVNESKARVGLRNICYLVEKAEKKWWSRLIKQGKPPVFLKVDWDKWVDEDEEQEHSFGADVTFGDMDFSKLNMDDQEGFDVDDEVGSYHSCDELEDSFIW